MALTTQEDMFRPPVAHGMRALDRAFFQKSIPLKAARIFDNQNISKIRSALERSKDALIQDRLQNIYPDPDPERAQAGKKCMLLRPEIQQDLSPLNRNSLITSEHQGRQSDATSTPWPHSQVVTELINGNLISIVPFKLQLDYTYWTYHDIVSSILPLEAQDEIPVGFAQVGHVAHVNLRDDYLPYKNLLADILLDKNPNVRTVINKIDDVGHENEFRTFKYEVLAGPDDMNVTVSEGNCTFCFDYSQVYWNTRLQTEHKRLVDLFREGEAVCDVMAGIGPFAVPAGKRGVFVWANDLNPDSYASLVDATSRNKVGDFVRPFNKDGREFIRDASAQLLHTDHKVNIKKKESRKDTVARPTISRTIMQPRSFQHFVLNLPASALTFLSSFIGLYPPELRAKLPEGTKMPLVHVYCFAGKDELIAVNKQLNVDFESPASTCGAADQIIDSISQYLQLGMKLGSIEEERGVEIYDVRDVAPRKRMFCATFRLPEEVAFRAR